MSISIAKDFRFFSLMRFALPSMVMMVFTSLYTIVDGFFISRYAGATALSATNIVYPVFNVVIAVGVMFASGGSALIARKMGEKKEEEARRDFSLIILTGIVLGIVIMLIGNLFLTPIVRSLGATSTLLPDGKAYLSILLWFAPACILQLLFQTFFVTAGKPQIGLTLTILAGLINMVFDYVFVYMLQMGVSGAALATGLGQVLPAAFGLVYFLAIRNDLYLVKPHFSMQTLFRSSLNGSSEMVTNISTAVVTYLFNRMMLRYAGEAGVAAITIVLYGQFLFNALYFGFSMGVAPVISFNYGRRNHTLLHRIFKICVYFVSVSSIGVTILALVFTPLVVGMFTPAGTEVYELASTGFFLFSFNYIFAGINIFASSMFTAFSDGPTSAIISFARTFLFITASILILPIFLGLTGVWISVPVAEGVTLVLSLIFFVKKEKRYGY